MPTSSGTKGDMSYPPSNTDGLLYRPINCGTPAEIMEILTTRLPEACEGAARNGVHECYHAVFAPLLARAITPSPPRPGPFARKRAGDGAAAVQRSARAAKCKGTVHTANKFRLLQDLFFSQAAADLAAADPYGFGRAREWARIIARLATVIADGLRRCLFPRLERVDQLIEGSRLLADDPNRKPRQTIAASLSKVSPPSVPMDSPQQLAILEKIAAFLENDSEHGSPVVTIDDQVGGHLGGGDTEDARSFVTLKMPNEAEQQVVLSNIAEGVASILDIEAEGVVSATVSGSWIPGLLCLTSLQSHLGADLDAHGLDFWVCWLMNHALVRNNPHLFANDKFAPHAGLDVSQKETRSESAQRAIYADMVRGTHSGIVRKLTVIWTDAMDRLVTRHNELAHPARAGIARLHELCPEFEERFPQLASIKASEYNKSKGIKRHETSDSGRRWDFKRRGAMSATVGQTDPTAGAGRLRIFSDTLLNRKNYNGIGVVSASPALLNDIAEARRFVYAQLVEADVDVAICVGYSDLLEHAKQRYQTHNPSFAKNPRAMFLSSASAVRSGILRDEEEIFIARECFSVHKSTEAMDKFGAGIDTPLPVRWSDRTLQFHCDPRLPRDSTAYRGTFEELFGSTGRGGTHGQDKALAKFRKRQIDCQEILEAIAVLHTKAIAASVGTVLLRAPPIVLRAGDVDLMDCVDKQAALATKAQTWHARLDEAVANSVARAKRNLILMAWRVALHSRLPPQTSEVSLPQPRHAFNEYTFVFEAMAFATRSSGGLSSLIRSQSGTLKIIDPLPDNDTEFAWPAEDWGVFCAIAEAAAYFLVPPHKGTVGYLSFLASTGGSPVKVGQGAVLEVDEKRLELATPLLDERIALAKSLYGNVRPRSFLELVETTNSSTFGPKVAAFLEWADESVLAAISGATTNPASASSSVSAAKHAISSFLGIPNGVRGLLPLKKFRPADNLFTDENAYAVRQEALCRASLLAVTVPKMPPRKRTAIDAGLTEADLFGSDDEE